MIERLPRERHLGRIIAAELAGVLTQLHKQPAAIGVGEAPDDLQQVPEELRVGHGSRLSPSAMLRIGTPDQQQSSSRPGRSSCHSPEWY